MTVETLTPTVNSRWRLDVNTGTVATPTWVQVRAITSLTPALNNTVQDATDYDTDGWGADAVTLRKWQLQCTVFRKYGTAGYDVGQEALRAAADALDLVSLRWYERGGQTGAEAYEGEALINWEPQGGDATGLGSANFTALGQGARRVITVPA